MCKLTHGKLNVGIVGNVVVKLTRGVHALMLMTAFEAGWSQLNRVIRISSRDKHILPLFHPIMLCSHAQLEHSRPVAAYREGTAMAVPHLWGT